MASNGKSKETIKGTAVKSKNTGKTRSATTNGVVKSKSTVTKSKNVKSKEAKNKKKEVKTENILLLVFVLLLILVVVLGVMVFNKSRETKGMRDANLSVPVFKKGSEEVISLSVKALSNEEEYVLKVTNKKGQEINKNKINYDLVVENNSSAKVTITKNNEKKNLMVDNKSTKIEGEKLKSGALDEAFYHIKITDFNKVSEDDKINIKIVS